MSARPALKPATPSVFSRALCRTPATRRSLVDPSSSSASSRTLGQGGSCAGRVLSPMVCSGLRRANSMSCTNSGAYSRFLPQGSSAETGLSSASRLVSLIGASRSGFGNEEKIPDLVTGTLDGLQLGRLLEIVAGSRALDPLLQPCEQRGRG